MTWTFLQFPDDPTDAGKVHSDWTRLDVIAALRADQQQQLRRELRQMTEWNRRAALLRVTTAKGASPDQEKRAKDEAAQIDKWFWDRQWNDDIDATTRPVTPKISPDKVAALAKADNAAAQDLAAIGTAVGAIKVATILLSALKADAGATGAGMATLTSVLAAADAEVTSVKGAAEKPATGDKAADSKAKIQAGLLTEQAAALKAMYEAMGARVEANEAILKSVLGTIAASGDAAGKTTAGEDAGMLEGALLAADTLRISASKIAAQVEAALDDTTFPVIVLGGNQTLNTGLWHAISARIATLNELTTKVEQELAAAETSFKSARQTETLPLFIGPVAAAVTAVGVIVANAANLASYFQVGFTSAGAAIEGLDDQLLVAAVAERLSRTGQVHLPDAIADEATATKVIEAITELRHRAATAKAKADALRAELVDPSNGSVAKALPAAAKVADSATALVEACETLLGSLATPDSNGVAPISVVATQARLGNVLDQGAKVLRVKVHRVASGLYTREDGKLMALFRRRENDKPDLHVSGGAVVSFVLHDTDGRIITAGVLRDQSQYLRLEEIDGWLERQQ